MIWVWLMALITLFLMGWFAYKLFSGGTPKLVVSGGDHGHGPDDDPAGGFDDTHSNSAPAENQSGEHQKHAINSASSGNSAASTATVAGVTAATGAAIAAGAASAHSANSAESANSTEAGAHFKAAPGPQSTNDPIVYDHHVASGAAISGSGNGSTGHAEGVTAALASEDASSVREMMKILNLRESDASRLGIDKSQFATLWQGSSDNVDGSVLSSVRSRLEHMLS